ncbi:hypothetical protein VTN77DRAFT_3137 [Rasamsonia byssochlamydoides]|uniref:uncharacterized protein n=1 Tax=Rasamsonia byssochlamydoides TaxID=89139 RepID=UPI0037423D7E
MATAVSSVNPAAATEHTRDPIHHHQEASPAPASAPAASDEQLEHPTAAQILLENFTLPTFPEKASGLQALTLTSDIKPTEYADLLSPTASDLNTISSIPQGIEALTLELFSLGYPPLFLTKLSKALPKLKTLTLYSQLVDGVSDGSRKDAGEFFTNVLVGKKENGGGLRELHLLDTFCRKGFVAGLGGILEDLHATGTAAGSQEGASSKSVLRFLEVSYTYRGHSDSNFLARIPGDELPTMLVPSLIAASFSLAAPVSRNSSGTTSELPDDPADVDENGVPIPGRKPEGIIPLPQTNPGVAILMRKLTGEGGEKSEEKTATKDETNKEKHDGKDKEKSPAYRPGSGPGPRNLKMLDATIYTLDTNQLASIVRAQQGLAVLSASVLVSGTEASKASLLEALRGGKDGSSGKDLEIVEIVGVPDGFEQESSDSTNTSSPKEEQLHNVFPSASDMADLSAHLPRLESFKMTMLRAKSFGTVEWNRSADGKWTGGVTKESQP